MKNLVYLAAAFVFFLTSCQKELSVESENPPGVSNVASFKLEVSSGSCANIKVNGSFVKGVKLIGANQVEISVNVSVPGAYNLSTTSINGMSFSASGSFSGTGVQKVTLTGAGTPVNSGTSNFTISAGGLSCSFNINVAGSAAAATITCGSAVVNGVYSAGTALSTQNSIQLQVNVSAPGAYSISSNTVNGMSFSSAGTFNATGTQTITLAGSGSPVSAGTATFTISLGTSSCSFSIPVSSGSTPAPLPDNNYFRFTTGGITVTGKIDSANAVFMSQSAGGFTFVIVDFDGEAKADPNSSDPDTTLSIGLIDVAGGVTVNDVYNTSATATAMANMATVSIDGILDDAEAGETITGVNIKITITAHDVSKKILQGSFSGTVKEFSGAIKTITNGVFKFRYP